MQRSTQNTRTVPRDSELTLRINVQHNTQTGARVRFQAAPINALMIGYPDARNREHHGAENNRAGSGRSCHINRLSVTHSVRIKEEQNSSVLCRLQMP